MINPQSINLSLLPSVPLARRKELPELPAIYFVMDSQGEVCYIGQSNNPRRRFATHHRLREFRQMPNSKVAYLLTNDIHLLGEIEKALINYFQPKLNGQKISSPGGLRARKAVTYRIDEAVIEAFKEMALDQNLSANRLLENYLFDLAKTKGYLKKDLKPIGETRGCATTRGNKGDD